jgi:hypothetical protein
MAKALNALEAKFIAFLQSDPEQNATQAAIKAGYSEKSAAQIAWQLLRKPKIKAELDAWKAKKREEISKEDFVDMAIKDYRSLDVTEPNKPRFLDIAGKTLGYIGANGDGKQATTINNLTQINFNGSESTGELWEMTRKLLGND